MQDTGHSGLDLMVRSLRAVSCLDILALPQLISYQYLLG